MKQLLLALLVTAAISAQAQYTIVLNDNTRLTVPDGSITFGGTGEDAYLEADGQQIPMADIAWLRSGQPAIEQQPIVLAYHTYYSPTLPKADAVTHINYAFAEVYVVDGVYQKFAVQGNIYNLKKCVKLKQTNPDLKILLSFTHTVVNSGNTQDGGFSAIAASAEYRQAFAQDCLAFLQANDLDGVDLDWEFPGLSWSGAACDPYNDVDNYTLLIQQLRETLGSDYLITFAGYCMDVKKASDGTKKYIDLMAVEPYIDFVNVMTYDLASAPQFHNAIKHSSSYWDIERTVKAYTDAGFPMEKMVLGIPCYVRHDFNSGGTVTWANLNTLTEADGYNIDNWNETAQVPYVTLNGTMWGSYDNPRSIDLKGAYSAARGLRGLMYWCTYEDDKSNTLGVACRDAVLKHW
ncbi:MAG: glycoside hydrolase family 18 [Bacteroidales bacterium]|nr:glycoside hydrolase family 18 [Bacteroidales bacterium]